jgi:hypothetical protein
MKHHVHQTGNRFMSVINEHDKRHGMENSAGHLISDVHVTVHRRHSERR